MAINIYSGSNGGANSTKRTPATSSAAARAEATTKAVGGDAVASNSGSTAVKSTGILGKITDVVKKGAGILKFLPGPVGNIASIVSKVAESANDPEWWNTVPGDGVSTNDPLQLISQGNVGITKTVVSTSAATKTNLKLSTNKIAILEFYVRAYGTSDYKFVISPDDKMITQYLLPAVRKVGNAIVLQDANNYREALCVQASLYALWRSLKKIKDFVTRGKTYLPNVNVSAFPLMDVANAPFLESFITRLEEYLHSNVRLPHTLCEYLTWRFGRVFKTSRSAKSGFVFYNVNPLTESIDNIDAYMKDLMAIISSDPQKQKASTDIYNAYLYHDQEVLVPLEGQEMYDPKEFCLRTNLDLYSEAQYFAGAKIENNIIMDSELDNPTVFMASTISCQTTQDEYALFPVIHARAYAYLQDSTGAEWKEEFAAVSLNFGTANTTINPTLGSVTPRWEKLPNGDAWYKIEIKAGMPYANATGTTLDFANPYTQSTNYAANPLVPFMNVVQVCKELDFYNVGLYMPFAFGRAGVGAVNLDDGETIYAVDMTNLSIDSAVVPDLIIRNEQVLAFANLMSDEHKTKDTYRQIEKRVAKDVANAVEQIPMASVNAK